jgi:hypothetical protein
MSFSLATQEKGVLIFIYDHGPPVVIVNFVIVFVLKKRWELICKAQSTFAGSEKQSECDRKFDCPNQ